MKDLAPPPAGPEAIGFDPPAPVFRVDESNYAVTDPLYELAAQMRVAIPNPWSKTESYAIGIIREVAGEFVLELGSSLGKLQLLEQGWVCVGLARMSAIAEAMALEMAPPEPKKFTDRLLKRAGRGRKK
jgi:hypothetical protein